MSEELQQVVQIIELYGRGLGALGRAIRFSAKGAAKGVDVAKVKTMQCKMKLHYASTGNHKTMKLSDLEKLTGGQYNILNIPLEDEKELTGFYDRLKKMHVSFAELPDLQLGDGYTQIAYNPMDAENVKMVIQYYRKRLSETPKDISVDQYMAMAGKDGRELLDELAEKGYTDGMHTEQLADIRDKIKSGDYISVSLNMETLLLQERKDSYVFRVPRGRMDPALKHAMIVPKKNCLLLDRGQTLVTCLEREGKTVLYHLDSDDKLMEGYSLWMKNSEFEKAFAPLSRQKKQQIERLKPEQTDIFPSFNQGQENSISGAKDSPAPETVLGRDATNKELEVLTEGISTAEVETNGNISNDKKALAKEDIPSGRKVLPDSENVMEKEVQNNGELVSLSEKQMAEILSAEQAKEYQSGSDYIPVSFDLDRQLITESEDVYIVSVPKEQDGNKKTVHCMAVEKKGTQLSEDGETLTAYLKRDGYSKVVQYDEMGVEIKRYAQTNEEIAAVCLKQRDRLPVQDFHLSRDKIKDVLPKTVASTAIRK